MWRHNNGWKSELMISPLTAPLWIYPSLSGVFLLSCPPYVFLVFFFFTLSRLLSLTFLILTPPPQRRDKARRQSSWAHLFVYIHLLRHKALMESNHSSPAACICARANVDTVPQRKTEMNLETYWIFSRHISKVCLLCPQDSVWQNISHATNMLKVPWTSRRR